jgi:hypothetical protein
MVYIEGGNARMMIPDLEVEQSDEIPNQRGRKRRKIGGELRGFSRVPRIGPPQCDTRSAAAKQPRGPYLTLPDVIVDSRPRVRRKPFSGSSRKLLELYYRLNSFIMALEELAPIEWAGETLLGFRRGRAYQFQREVAEHGDLEGWFRQKALAGMKRGRIHRGRATEPSRIADAFFIALAGGVPEAKSLAYRLTGNVQSDLLHTAADDRDAADAEVRDYMVHSRLLWRLFGEDEIDDGGDEKPQNPSN